MQSEQADEQIGTYCNSCGAKLDKYKMSLTKSLAQTLIKIYRLQKALGKKEIWLGHDDKGTEFELTPGQRNNATRLRFLGLARYTNSHSGRWIITRRGYQFLNGEPVPKFVWTFRNKIIEDMRTDETLTLTEVFRKGDQPYFEPVTDKETASESDVETAVRRTGGNAVAKMAKGICANPDCQNPVEIKVKFGQPIQGVFCSDDCRRKVRGF